MATQRKEDRLSIWESEDRYAWKEMSITEKREYWAAWKGNLRPYIYYQLLQAKNRNNGPMYEWLKKP